MALLYVNAQELETAISSGDIVLAYFWTDWHDACKEVTPVLEELANNHAENEHIKICAINADENGFLALDLGMYTIPAVIVYQNGEEVDRIAGPQPLALYEQFIETCLHPEEINPYELIQSMGHL